MYVYKFESQNFCNLSVQEIDYSYSCYLDEVHGVPGVEDVPALHALHHAAPCPPLFWRDDIPGMGNICPTVYEYRPLCRIGLQP